MADTKRRVAYFYCAEVGNYHYGLGHPMKPHRVRMTHNLIVNYGLHRKMEVFRPVLLPPSALTKFHTDDYINFLQTINPGGAVRLNQKASDVVINWAGGLHHAKKSEASGFCYVNDCVLAILELLKVYQRVLYIDIDIHHGDGVEEAFYTTNRVMTASFHKFGEYFPGTGDVKDKGVGDGEGYAINVPLQDGMDDNSFKSVFQPIIQKIMELFIPEAVVMQCGADSLSGDRLGCFNLSVRGHSECVEFVKGFCIPMLVVGGGGYTLRHVPRCWCNETAVLLDVALRDPLPYNDYYEYYGPEYRLHLPVSNMQNKNTPAQLDAIRTQVLEILRFLEAAPGTQIHTGQTGTTEIPSSPLGEGAVSNAMEVDDDVRPSEGGGRRENPNEFYDLPTPEELVLSV